MAKVSITDSSLYAIANAIRSKLSASEVYKPSQMAAAIESIPEGYPEPTGTINITANGTANVKDYASANVNVPNTYAAGDEGKVVSNGILVSQGSDTATENGTYDTTLISELIVNVSGGISEMDFANYLTFEQGGYASSANVLYSSAKYASDIRIRCDMPLPILRGEAYHFKFASAYRVNVFEVNDDLTMTGDTTGWKNSDFTYTPTSPYILIVIALQSEASISPSDYSNVNLQIILNVSGGDSVERWQ